MIIISESNSMGNINDKFVLECHPSNPRDKDTMIFQSEFSFRDEKLLDCTGWIIPCRISSVDHANDYKPAVLEGSEGQRVLERIYKYSRALKYGIQSLL